MEADGRELGSSGKRASHCLQDDQNRSNKKSNRIVYRTNWRQTGKVRHNVASNTNTHSGCF